MHRHLQKSRKIRERTAQSERERNDPHVFDRGIRKHSFDVASAVDHEAGEYERDEPHRHHHRARGDDGSVAGHDHLESQQRKQRHIEQ